MSFPILKNTSKSDQKMAADSLSEITEILSTIEHSEEKGVELRIQETGASVTIPKKALSLLNAILKIMAEGEAITIIPSDSELSAQQAADVMNVSRPHLVKLLKAGKIPFKKVGSHRRILLKDLIKYEETQQTEREKQLKFLSEEAQELNLGYE